MPLPSPILWPQCVYACTAHLKPNGFRGGRLGGCASTHALPYVRRASVSAGHACSSVPGRPTPAWPMFKAFLDVPEVEGARVLPVARLGVRCCASDAHGDDAGDRTSPTARCRCRNEWLGARWRARPARCAKARVPSRESSKAARASARPLELCARAAGWGYPPAPDIAKLCAPIKAAMIDYTAA